MDNGVYADVACCVCGGGKKRVHFFFNPTLKPTQVPTLMPTLTPTNESHMVVEKAPEAIIKGSPNFHLVPAFEMPLSELRPKDALDFDKCMVVADAMLHPFAKIDKDIVPCNFDIHCSNSKDGVFYGVDSALSCCRLCRFYQVNDFNMTIFLSSNNFTYSPHMGEGCSSWEYEAGVAGACMLWAGSTEREPLGLGGMDMGVLDWEGYEAELRRPFTVQHM